MQGVYLQEICSGYCKKNQLVVHFHQCNCLIVDRESWSLELYDWFYILIVGHFSGISQNSPLVCSFIGNSAYA